MNINWDAVGAIAELAGSIAVVASLAYLGVQIRQNTTQMERSIRIARGQSYQDLLSSIQGILVPVPMNEAIADIIRRGMEDFHSLNQLEQFRFNWTFAAYIFTCENAFYQKKDGMLTDERFEQAFKIVKSFFIQSPGFRQWWKVHPNDTLHPEFVAMLNVYLNEAENTA